MKKALIIILSLSLTVLAQKPKVAVGAIGDEPKNFKALKGLSTKLTEAIVNSGKYMAVDRSEDILKQLGKEHGYQRGGAVDDEQIKELGKQFAVQYLCIVGSSELKAGEYMLEARLVNIETAEIVSMGSDPSSLKDMKELMIVAEVLAKKLLGSGASPAQEKTAPLSVQSGVSGGVLTDARDGKEYKTVMIGSQTWMAENLNYDASGSKCYSNLQANCEKYGKLYNWATAMALPSSCNSSSCSSQIKSPHRGICPSGWHIPSDAEWTIITAYVGSSTAGTKLKAKSGWNSNGNGTNEYGFSALPGGSGFSSGSFPDVGDFGYWWSATESNASDAYFRGMRYNFSYVDRISNLKSYQDSVRCLQD